MWLYSPVCVGPGRKPPKTGFLRTRLLYSFDNKCDSCLYTCIIHSQRHVIRKPFFFPIFRNSHANYKSRSICLIAVCTENASEIQMLLFVCRLESYLAGYVTQNTDFLRLGPMKIGVSHWLCILLLTNDSTSETNSCNYCLGKGTDVETHNETIFPRHKLH